MIVYFKSVLLINKVEMSLKIVSFNFKVYGGQ